MATTEITLDHVRQLTRQLPPAAKLLLIRDLTEQLLDTTPTVNVATTAPFPVLHGGTWPPDFPRNRQELYDDRSIA